MSFVFVDMSSLASHVAEMDMAAERVPSAVDEADRRMVERIAQKGIEYAPKETGALAGTIEAEDLGDGMMAAVAGDADVPYAGPIHWGWPAHHIDGQPFLWRAYKEEEAALDQGRADYEIEPVIEALEA